MLIRQKFGISDRTKVILTVCRLVERKGVDTLLQAISQITNHKSRVTCHELLLVVVGNGPYAAQLHQLAELLKVPVRWIEDATDDEVAQWYAAVDIFCLPARETPDDVEGFGMVFLEAAAAGLPVIAGRGWGTEEAVIDGITGLVVPPTATDVFEALLKLLDDDQLRCQLGEAGRQRVLRDFKWQDRWKLLNSPFASPLIKGGLQSSEIASLSKGGAESDEAEEFTQDIAVVIPCYNHALELRDALEGLAGQTLAPQEVIVVDDASDDNPETAVKEFESRLPLRYVRLEQQSGAPAARNHGARHTSAPFILFLDADVKLESHALETMRRALDQNQQASLAYSDFYWGAKKFRGRPWDPQALRRMNWIHTSSLLRRAAWVPFDESLKKFQDWDLWLTMAEKGLSGVWIPEPLLSVKERKAGISYWLPAFVHRLPWPILGWTPREVRRYREAETVIKTKHGAHNMEHGAHNIEE